VGEQANGPVAGPVSERVGLLLGLGLGKVELQDGVTGGGAVGDLPVLEGRLDLERPLLRALLDQPRERVEPGRAAGLLAPPPQLVRN
jgi:hypothetical protein